jgi:hypothetical protein
VGLALSGVEIQYYEDNIDVWYSIVLLFFR